MGRRRRGKNERNGYVTITRRAGVIVAYLLDYTGIFQREMLVTGAEGLTLAMFTRMLGWKKSEVDVLVANVRRALQDPKIHTYTKL